MAIRLSGAQITRIKDSLQWRIGADAYHVPKYKIEDLVEDILEEVLPCPNQSILQTPNVQPSVND